MYVGAACSWRVSVPDAPDIQPPEARLCGGDRGAGVSTVLARTACTWPCLPHCRDLAGAHTHVTKRRSFRLAWSACLLRTDFLAALLRTSHLVMCYPANPVHLVQHGSGCKCALMIAGACGWRAVPRAIEWQQQHSAQHHERALGEWRGVAAWLLSAPQCNRLKTCPGGTSICICLIRHNPHSWLMLGLEAWLRCICWIDLESALQGLPLEANTGVW